MLANYRLSLSEFLSNAAKDHQKKTGVEVKGFCVPRIILDGLKKEPRVQESAIPYMVYVDEFTVLASDTREPTLFEKKTGRGVPLL